MAKQDLKKIKPEQNQRIFEKFGFSILIALNNQTEKWSCLFFYLLRTQKYPEMFLTPFYAPGPLKKTSHN